MAPAEHVELCRQVQDLILMGFIGEIHPPCAVQALFTPKKDESCLICVDIRAINAIIVKYSFHILRLDDLLVVFMVPRCFPKLTFVSVVIIVECLSVMNGKWLLKQRMALTNV